MSVAGFMPVKSNEVRYFFNVPKRQAGYQVSYHTAEQNEIGFLAINFARQKDLKNVKKPTQEVRHIKVNEIHLVKHGSNLIRRVSNSILEPDFANVVSDLIFFIDTANQD